MAEDMEVVFCNEFQDEHRHEIRPFDSLEVVVDTVESENDDIPEEVVDAPHAK
jgi:hypothetical protein